jgi:hypothetical protein
VGLGIAALAGRHPPYRAHVHLGTPRHPLRHLRVTRLLRPALNVTSRITVLGAPPKQSNSCVPLVQLPPHLAQRRAGHVFLGISALAGRHPLWNAHVHLGTPRHPLRHLRVTRRLEPAYPASLEIIAQVESINQFRVTWSRRAPIVQLETRT